MVTLDHLFRQVNDGSQGSFGCHSPSTTGENVINRQGCLAGSSATPSEPRSLAPSTRLYKLPFLPLTFHFFFPSTIFFPPTKTTSTPHHNTLSTSQHPLKSSRSFNNMNNINQGTYNHLQLPTQVFPSQIQSLYLVDLVVDAKGVATMASSQVHSQPPSHPYTLYSSKFLNPNYQSHFIVSSPTPFAASAQNYFLFLISR